MPSTRWKVELQYNLNELNVNTVSTPETRKLHRRGNKA
jgi:hypothetical protein